MNGPVRRNLLQYSIAHTNAPGNLTSESKWMTLEFRKKCTGWKIPWKKASEENTIQMGRQNQKGLLIVTDVRGWRRLAGDGELLKRPGPVAGCSATEEE